MYIFLLSIYFVSFQVLSCIGGSVNTFDLERPGKNLCMKQDVDCSNQVTSSDPKVCLMKYFNQTSKECSNEEFKGDADLKKQYGTVNITPFPWFDTGIPFPALNITFSNILWRRLKMRFVQVGSDTAELCREFVLSQDVDVSTIISFDCLWGSGVNADLNYKFQYIITTKDGHKLLSSYLLRIPKDVDSVKGVDAENCGLFLMMDETAFPIISTKLQVAASKIKKPVINVTLFYKEDLTSDDAPLQFWAVNVTNEQEEDFVNFGTYDTQNTLGYYYFNASFLNYNCEKKYIESTTPLLKVTGLKISFGAMTFLLVLIFGILGLVTWRSVFKTGMKDSGQPASVLFVYESCYPSHIENIYKFKEFLEDNCCISPKLDLIEIPKTNSMNPWKWYYSAFEEAEFVLVFASPDESTEKGVHEDNVYQGLYTYALKMLFVYLLHKHKFLVANIKLPGCSWRTLPSEVSLIDKRFSLPEKLNHLFKFLKISPMKNGSSTFLKALKQSRSFPKLNVSRPLAPLPLPFDADDFSLDEEMREPLTIGKATLNLDGHSSSEEDDEEDFKRGSFNVDCKL